MAKLRSIIPVLMAKKIRAYIALVVFFSPSAIGCFPGFGGPGCCSGIQPCGGVPPCGGGFVSPVHPPEELPHHGHHESHEYGYGDREYEYGHGDHGYGYGSKGRGYGYGNGGSPYYPPPRYEGPPPSPGYGYSPPLGPPSYGNEYGAPPSPYMPGDGLLSPYGFGPAPGGHPSSPYDAGPGGYAAEKKQKNRKLAKAAVATVVATKLNKEKAAAKDKAAAMAHIVKN